MYTVSFFETNLGKFNTLFIAFSFGLMNEEIRNVDLLLIVERVLPNLGYPLKYQAW